MLAEKSTRSGMAGVFSDVEACERLGIAAIAIDTGFDILLFNEKARRMTGYPRDMAARKKVFDVIVGGELKKCLAKAFSPDHIQPDFSAKGSLITREGRIRKVDCKVIATYDNGKPSGALITLIDVTAMELARSAARIAVREPDMEAMATEFLKLLGDPLNLKIARVSICRDGRTPHTYTEVFPHGGVLKKPRHALNDSPEERDLEVRYFKLKPGDRSVGVLETVAYAGSPLTNEDLALIRSICDVLSAGLARLMPPVRRRPMLPAIGGERSAVALVDALDNRTIDASTGFRQLTGADDPAGSPIDVLLPGSGIGEHVKTVASRGLPVCGAAPGIGLVYCCMPAGDTDKGTQAVLISLADPAAPAPETAEGPGKGVVNSVQDLMSAVPHGIAVCDQTGLIIAANDVMARITGAEKRNIEGQSMADVLQALKPRTMGGHRAGRSLDVVSTVLRTGQPVLAHSYQIEVHGSRRAINVSAMPLPAEGQASTGCVVTVRDITVLSALLRLGRMAFEAMDIDDFVEEALDEIANAARLKFAWLYHWDGIALSLRLQKGRLEGVPLPECHEAPDQENPTPESKAFLTGKPVLIKDYRRCATVRRFDPMARSRAIRSMAAVPLLINGITAGVLVVGTDLHHRLDEVQLSEILALCDQLSTGMSKRAKNSQAIRKLKTS